MMCCLFSFGLKQPNPRHNKQPISYRYIEGVKELHFYKYHVAQFSSTLWQCDIH